MLRSLHIDTVAIHTFYVYPQRLHQPLSISYPPKLEQPQLHPLVPKRQVQRSGACIQYASKKGASTGDDDVWRHLSKMADKYITGPSSSQQHMTGYSGTSLPVQGIHVLLSILVIVWLITSSSTLPAVSAKLLSLENSPHKWWSFVTDAFVSNSGEQLFRNLFMGYMFGRVVENSESTKALWITYLMSAAGGSAAAWLMLPRRAPIQGCANTAAILGLCSTALLFNSRKSWHWQRLFEMAVVLPFVCQQLLAGHASLSHWCLLFGYKMGAWVPLIGGFAGAAVAAALLLLARMVVRGIAQQQQRAAAAGGSGSVPEGPSDATLSELLGKAVTQLLRRVL